MNIVGGAERLNRFTIAVAVLAILIVTLAPTESGPPSGFSFAFDFGRRGWSDAILNFLLFFPLGLAVAWDGRPAYVAGICGMLLAAGIEAAQTVLPGRDPALSDIILNASGALAGGVFGRRRYLLLAPNPKESALLAVASLVLATLLMVGTGYLLSPMRAPVTADRTLQLPVSPSDGPGDVRSLISVQMPSAPEPIVIARSGNDLLLRYPSKGAAKRFDEPEYWSAGAFARRTSGERTPLSVTRDRSRWYVNIGSDLFTLGPTVGAGWATLAYPDAIGRRWGWMVNAIWMLAVFVPTGYWARGRLRLVAGFAGVTLLAVVPPVTGLLPTKPLEWCGAFAGFVLGAGLGELRRRKARR